MIRRGVGQRGRPRPLKRRDHPRGVWSRSPSGTVPMAPRGSRAGRSRRSCRADAPPDRAEAHGSRSAPDRRPRMSVAQSPGFRWSTSKPSPLGTQMTVAGDVHGTCLARSETRCKAANRMRHYATPACYDSPGTAASPRSSWLKAGCVTTRPSQINVRPNVGESIGVDGSRAFQPGAIRCRAVHHRRGLDERTDATVHNYRNRNRRVRLRCPQCSQSLIDCKGRLRAAGRRRS